MSNNNQDKNKNEKNSSTESTKSFLKGVFQKKDVLADGSADGSTKNNPSDNKKNDATQQETTSSNVDVKTVTPLEKTEPETSTAHTKTTAKNETSTSKQSLPPLKEIVVKKEQPPADFILPLIPIREGVLFPHTESVLTFGRKTSLEAIKQSKHSKNLVALVTQRKPETNQPKSNDLYSVGTLAVVERTLNADGQVNALVRGIGRVKVAHILQTKPYYSAKVLRVKEFFVKDNEIKALSTHLQKLFRKAVNMGKPVEFLNFMKLMSGVNEGELTDQIASTLSVPTKTKQHILELFDVKERLKVVIDHLTKETKVLEIEKDVASKTQQKFEKHMRESVLRERMKTIQKELGELDDDEAMADEYETKLKKLKASPDTKQKISREVKRLRQMSVNNPESGYIRSWLDTMFDLPWGKRNKGNIDLSKAGKILEKNHYGLEKVKDRVLEFIAVLQLKQDQKVKKDAQKRLPTILCFVGPPGVGKTSIGKSIAKALGREFVKISLGGIRDEAEIRGHRRTYVGAMPGRIINGIKQAGKMNPVFMLDEVDKIGKDFRGDPSAALLEALDPEQNAHFEDHYLDVPFDLSDVIFITTANTLDTIPSALRDRLEIIRYAGYTEEEKFHIAKKHLISKVYKANGLKKKQLSFSDKLLKTIIQRYTREAGVRDLERNINKVMRKAARTLLETKKKKISLDKKLLKEYLGPEKYDVTFTEKEDQVGLATGLAWTQVGGDVLFIEVALTPGKGEIKLTGKLGEVMKESAQAALTYVKANADKLNIDIKKIEKSDIHVHVPEGAVPKDGPSAGITITTAMVSAFTDTPVKKIVAMTGEVTLRGRVLRIGGLKEKAIAAHRAGCKTVIIPLENERDLVEIPQSVTSDIEFKPVKTVDQVLKIALGSQSTRKK